MTISDELRVDKHNALSGNTTLSARGAECCSEHDTRKVSPVCAACTGRHFGGDEEEKKEEAGQHLFKANAVNEEAPSATTLRQHEECIDNREQLL